MMRKKCNDLKSNSGFSLVELIAATAILVIVAAALLAFFSYALGQYGRTNDEVNIQHESQLFSRQFESFVITTTNAVSVTNDETGNSTVNLYNVEKTVDEDGNVANNKICYKIYADSSDRTIKFQQISYPASGNPQIGESEVLASFVKEDEENPVFVCTVYDDEGKVIDTSKSNDVVKPAKITYDITFESGKKQFQSHNEAAFRNTDTIIGTSNLTKIYENLN